jgi:DNA-binding transcriptional LysR family regulator
MLRADLAELTAFITIAEQRSFRGAARVLGLSPSALSHTIRNLETRLDVRLFNRTTRSVALTETGERLLQRVRPALADLTEAVDEAGSAQDHPSGTIRISAAEAGARPLIRHVLPDFLAAYPDIHVEFVVDTRMIDIVADGFDAGIRVEEDVPRDMIAIPFGGPWRFMAVASPAYLAGKERPVVPQDLLRHACIRFRFTSGALYLWDLEKDGKPATIDVQGPMTLGNTNLMLEAALNGIGIAWLPESLVADHLTAGRLVDVLPEWNHAFPGPASITRPIVIRPRHCGCLRRPCGIGPKHRVGRIEKRQSFGPFY